MKSSLTTVLSCERTAYGYILRRTQPSMRLTLFLTLIPISIFALLAFVLDPEDRVPYLLFVAVCLAIQLLVMLPLFFLSKGQRAGAGPRGRPPPLRPPQGQRPLLDGDSGLGLWLCRNQIWQKLFPVLLSRKAGHHRAGQQKVRRCQGAPDHTDRQERLYRALPLGSAHLLPLASGGR